jgi:hypothetical protein
MPEIHNGSQEGFMLWLEKFEDNDVIGYSKDARGCPLQHYLKDINTDLQISVGTELCFFWYDYIIQQRALEEWESLIVYIADSMFGPITKKEFSKREKRCWK